MEVDGVGTGPSIGNQELTTVADAVAVVARGQVGNDVMAKAGEMMEKLSAKNLALHGKFFVEKMASARVLMNDICLQQDRKKKVDEKKGVAWLLAAEKATQENGAAVEQVKKDVLAVLMKAGEQVGALTASLELAWVEAEGQKKREAAI